VDLIHLFFVVLFHHLILRFFGQDFNLVFVFSECRICFEEVDNLEYFYSHVKIHSGKTQYECKYCFLGKLIGSYSVAAVSSKICFYWRYQYALLRILIRIRCLFDSGIRNRFFRIPDLRSRISGPGSRVPDFGSRVRIPDLGSRISDHGSRIPNPYFESLMTIFWVEGSVILCKLAQFFFFTTSKLK
jgi:hypothetical protein